MDAPSFDTTIAHPARIYDYLLGGKNNFPVDRAAAEEAMRSPIPIRKLALANRAFLGRAVRFAAESGIRQFLDLGTGIPSPGNTGEVARAIRPDARVVYVDHDPIVAAHSRALLADEPKLTTVLQADVRDPAAILASEQVRGLLDFSEPIAVLMVAVLHFVPDEADPHAIVRAFADAVPSGSALVISHGGDFAKADEGLEIVEIYKRSTSPVASRTNAEIRAFFDGFDLVEPGLVQLPWWRPDGEVLEEAKPYWLYAGVGVKP